MCIDSAGIFEFSYTEQNFEHDVSKDVVAFEI